MTAHIGIYLYPNAEVLDFSGPFEVFTTATRVSGEDMSFAVSLISESGGQVVARSGYRVMTDYPILRHPPLDVLMVAGGLHTDELANNAVIAWIKEEANGVQFLSSVCTGAFLLAQAGLCAGKRVTTHWEDIPAFRTLFPDVEVVESVRWVEDGKLITSAGISAGMDMSLYLVERLHSRALAEKTARQLDFDWRQSH